ncbi:tetratricopeptide repeat protein [Nostoc sp. CHAB 5834]|nr:tetratricopeptide repeat protein [Nostoc sp. CHAB 5834]
MHNLPSVRDIDNQPVNTLTLLGGLLLVHYRLKFLSVATLVLSLFLFTSFAQSKTRRLVPTILTAQAQTTQELREEALQLTQLGFQQLSQSQFQQAVKTFEQALVIFRQIGDRQGEGATLNSIGANYENLGQYTKALEVSVQALAILKEMGDKSGEAITLSNIGKIYESLGQYTKALEFHEQGLAIEKQLANQAHKGIILNNIGQVYDKLGEYAKALELYQKALAVHKQFRNQAAEGVILSNIGTVYQNQGEYAKALEFHQQALAIHKQFRNQAAEGVTLNNIATVYKNQGHYAKALKFFQQGLAIHQQVGTKVLEGTTFNNIAAVYDDLGQYAKALEFYQQALAIHKQIDYKAGEGITLNNIGVVYDSLGQYAKALESYQKALAIRKQISDKAGEGFTLNNIGKVYKSQGQYAEGLKSYQQALAIHKQIRNKAGKGLTLSNIGGVYAILGQYTKALEFYQQALAIHKQIGDTAGQGITLSNIGVVYGSQSKYADAEKTLFAAIKVNETLRTRDLTDDQKISIFETQASTYRFLQKALIAQNKTNTALEISERSRARAFIELLASKISGNIDNQQAIKPPNIEQIKQIAKVQNATLVEYSIMESKLYIWVIKPTGKIAFKEVDIKSLNTSLADLVKESRVSICVRGRGINIESVCKSNKNQELQKNNPNLQKLYQVLIEPIASLLPTNPDEHVIFIPHDSLFLVPFIALQDKDGKYLIEKHTILTAPAIQILDLTHQQRQKVTGEDVLVMGNPIMPKVGIPPVQLPPLAGAEKEALTIANLFKIKAITGKDATKAAFKEKLSTARIIHLATHGLLDDADKSIPSAIALTPTSNDDGLLTPAEIVDLKINAELVVLSACDTGRGAITGDGVVGLSRSLITAGAPSVIVSLWKVPDSATSELMTEFYQQWEQNPDKAVALRNAMLITMKKHPQPVNWAAFTLIGES